MKLSRITLTALIVLSVLLYPFGGPNTVDAENRHGDPGNAGRVNFVGDKPMTTHWSLPVKQTKYSDRVTASNGREVFVITGVKTVDCVDSDSGESIWETPLETPSIVTGTPTITDNMAVVTCANGYIVAYDLKRGCEIFRLSSKWDQFSNPIIGENYIFVKAIEENDNSGAILAINPVTGKVSSMIPCFSKKHPPTVGSGKLFVPHADDVGFSAFSEYNLEYAWESDVVSEIDFISTRFDRVCVVSANIVFMFDVQTGELLWKKSIHGSYEISWSPAISAELVFLASKNAKRITALDFETGEIVWERFLKSKTWRPLVDKTRIILTLERSIQIREQESGELLWEVETVGATTGNVLAVSDSLFFSTSLSKIISLKTAGYEIDTNVDSIDLGSVLSDAAYIQSSDMKVSNRSDEEIEVTFETGLDWLTASPRTLKLGGKQQSSLLITADVSRLPIGDYAGEITVTWSHGEHTVPVNLSKIQEPEPEPAPAFFETDMAEIKETGALNLLLKSKLIQIRNTGESSGEIKVYTDSSWMLLTKTTLKIEPSSHAEIGVTFIPSLAAHGENFGKITLVSDSGQVIKIDVVFERIPGIKKVIVEIKEGREWIKINNIRFRSRPAPIFKNREVLIPINLIHLILDSKQVRWKGNPDAPCKTVYNQIIRDDVVAGNCEGSDMLDIRNKNGERAVQMNHPSEIIDGQLMIPIKHLLSAFDEDLLHRDQNGLQFYELNFPEKVPENQ